MELDLQDVIFDQYSRYRSAAEVLSTVCGADDTLLDVGSGPECLLGRFLPRHSITYIDPLLKTSDGPDRHGRTLESAALEDGDFDWTHKIPLQRAGSPGDYAEVILFLAAGGDYVNGQTLTVDGGLTI